ncbi:haloacetate dehalogenase [Kineococcus xinjiangensis]|uniref:Haloacetate dehalogenase n=1 Tax=Kineococcus xinjiangensis TaxID=512762 RepID=A0A2S6IED9_9ACTN|nr:alpha/beta hydrolase [Kineococcus xinjiangensis]PPK92582.1 haloacetate dehalogenase [Kineococcus xinjiangensis]
MVEFFPGFSLEHLDVGGGVRLRVRTGGSGPAVVLLHGHPRTHTTWHRVAPELAREFTVVCPDLRGYGQSSKPTTAADHAPYSKRAMAADVLALMRSRGHERFAVVGHDRGSYVAHRLAVDSPEAVRHLTVVDSVPIGEALARADARFARLWWHWFFLGQTEKPAERLISADPLGWYRPDVELMGARNHADLVEAVSDPATVHAMCEDYRAGLGVDRAADDADRAAGRRVRCPVLVLWSSRDDMAELYGDPRRVWRSWADDVDGHEIDSGHHVAEENPAALVAALREALREALRKPDPR